MKFNIGDKVTFESELIPQYEIHNMIGTVTSIIWNNKYYVEIYNGEKYVNWLVDGENMVFDKQYYRNQKINDILNGI